MLGGLKLFACVFIALAASGAVGAQGAAPSRGASSAKTRAILSRAILSRGTEAVRGLPFFSPNAIPALRAEYLLAPADAQPADAATAVGRGRTEPLVRVWSTREPLVFGQAWARDLESQSDTRRALLLGRPEGPVLALLEGGYVLLFELPAGADAAAYRSFALALDRRFAIFFDHAPSDADLSFPASVDFSR